MSVPPPPFAGVDTFVLFGRYVNPGTALGASGRLTINTPQLLVPSTGLTITAKTIVVDLDGQGYYQVTLPVNDDPQVTSPAPGWVIAISEAITGESPAAYTIAVSTAYAAARSGLVPLAELSPIAVATGNSSYIVQGPQGNPGTPGAAGAASTVAGLQGPAGSAGAPGSAGPAGSAGAASTVPGPAGASILTTSGVPSAGFGANGDYALDSPAALLYGPKASNLWPGSPRTVVGPVGGAGAVGAASTVAGPPGASILATSGAPAAGFGANGDYALDLAAGLLYGPRAAGAWPGTSRSIIGASGGTGLQGPIGPDGPTGPLPTDYVPQSSYDQLAAVVNLMMYPVYYAGSVSVARPLISGPVAWWWFPTKPTNMANGDAWYFEDAGVAASPFTGFMDFEGYIAGAVMDNTTAASGSLHLDSVNIPALTTAVAQTADKFHGTTSMKLNINTGAVSTATLWGCWRAGLGGRQTKLSTMCFVKLDALPTAGNNMIVNTQRTLVTAPSTYGNGCAVRITNTGAAEITDAANAKIAGTPTTVVAAIGQWLCVELDADYANSHVRARVTNMTTSVEVVLGDLTTARSISPGCDEVRAGLISPIIPSAGSLDLMAFQTAGGWLRDLVV